MTTKSGLQWSSRLTFVLAAVGCAVGLGNIWLFPFLAGANGGGAFVIVYLVAVVVLSFPVLLSELLVGRRGAAGPPEAIAAVAAESGHSRNWRWVGVILGGVGAVLSLAFYSVAGGWSLAYIFKLAGGGMKGVDVAGSELAFNTLNGTAGSLLPWFTLFIVLTVLISARGLHDGLEKAVRFMMPALFVMLLLVVGYSAVVGNFGDALSFLFTPDFSKLDSKTVLAAFGAAFFSVSVGITNMMAYGSYIDRETRLLPTAATVVAADTLVALTAGLMIFPLIFAYGLEPGGGPGLVFMTLPIAFGQIPGGQIFGAMFFVLLFFAALTSSIGMLEAPVSMLRDSTRLSRRTSVFLTGSISFVLGIFAVLSFNTLSGFHPLGFISMFEGKDFFNTLLHIVLNLLMPVGGIFTAVFVGWLIKRQFTRDELVGDDETMAYKMWLFAVRFVSPLLLAFVLFDVANG